jgi:hypothetical protein
MPASSASTHGDARPWQRNSLFKGSSWSSALCQTNRVLHSRYERIATDIQGPSLEMQSLCMEPLSAIVVTWSKSPQQSTLIIIVHIGSYRSEANISKLETDWNSPTWSSTTTWHRVARIMWISCGYMWIIDDHYVVAGCCWSTFTGLGSAESP